MERSYMDTIYGGQDLGYDEYAPEPFHTEPADELAGLGTMIRRGSDIHRKLRRVDEQVAAGAQLTDEALPKLGLLRQKVASITMTLDRALRLDGESWEDRFEADYQQHLARRAGHTALQAPDTEATQPARHLHAVPPLPDES
jgi:hypothetical protein